MTAHMRAWVLLICCLAAGRASVQWAAAADPFFHSVSGQFSAMVVGWTGVPSPAPTVLSLPGMFIVNPSAPAAEGQETTLDPALVVISCEQIKQSLLRDLGLPDRWQGR